MKKILVIFDNGHGAETAGKRSPIFDGKQIYEWEYTRMLTKLICEKLDNIDYVDYHLLVPEDKDISLSERCYRANTLYEKNKNDYSLIFGISVHLNAGGGTGFESYSYLGESFSDEINKIFYNICMQMYVDNNLDYGVRNKNGHITDINAIHNDADPDKDENFYILKHTKMPFVLTENFFMDNEKDFNFLISNNGSDFIVDLHVNSILDIYKKIS